MFPGFTAPKLVWVRNHEPDVFAKIAKVLLPKDFLRLWLTGEQHKDIADYVQLQPEAVRKRWQGIRTTLRERFPAVA